jgi:hypothetical protein
MAQLRMAATSQQLYYVDQNAYAGNVTDLEAYGFRQGASGYSRGGRCQYLLYAGPWWRRHVQDHPGYGQACIRRMLGAFSAHRTRSAMQN